MDASRVGARGDGLSRGSRSRERRPLGLLGNLRAMPRGLALLLLMLLVFSCTSGAGLERGSVVPSSFIELGPSERAEEQRRSLTHVFYRGNSEPPTPSARELRRLERDLETAPEIEVRELRGLFGNDLELLAYATRDTDGDGVLDYRISEYRGKFFEGDIDLDGDGIRNVYDAEPYNRKVGGVDTDGDQIPDKPGSFADRDGDGIPNHLDWSRPKGEAMAALQTGLFRDFGIILVERSARYTPELAQAVDDTMRMVFRESIPALRTVAVEDKLLISPDLGDNGFMLGQTQTLTICVDSIADAEPIVMLGLVIHEVGHAWQLAQDFDHHDLHGENKKMHFPPGDFTHSLHTHGWEVDTNSIGEGYYHRLYWPHFYATSPRYTYRGHAPNEWAAWFEDLQRELGSDFLRHSPAMTWGMVGPYSLTSPWEWHADHLMASVYNRMDQGVLDHPNHTYRSVAPELSERMLDTVQAQWSRFDYRNAAGTGIERELADDFELSDAEVQVLVDRYVVPLVDLPMLALAASYQQPAPPSELDNLKDGLAATWSDVRAHVDAPLSHVPSLNTLALAGVEPWRERSTRTPRPTGQPEPADTRAVTELDALPDATDGNPAPDTDTEAERTEEPPVAARPLVLREALEQATDSKLGNRHGAGRVGGVCLDPIPPAPTDPFEVAESAEIDAESVPEPEPAVVASNDVADEIAEEIERATREP